MDETRSLEAKRQAVHMLVGLFMAAAVWYAKPALGDYMIAPMLIIITTLVVTPRIAPKFPVISHLLFHFERKEDIERFPFKGAVWYNVGITFPIILLSRETACAVIVILSIGDAASTIVGKFYGRHRMGHKSLEGSAAFLMSSFVGALTLLSMENAMILAMSGTLIELLDSRLDDNLSIPLGLTIVSRLVGL